MILGIGLDIVEMKRIKAAHEKSRNFAERILSVRELAQLDTLSKARQIEYLAGRFAAKEAYSKANGTGIREGCSFQQIEVLNDELGKPILYFDGIKVNGFVSITHTKEVAAAQVILQSNV